MTPKEPKTEFMIHLEDLVANKNTELLKMYLFLFLKLELRYYKKINKSYYIDYMKKHINISLRYDPCVNEDKIPGADMMNLIENLYEDKDTVNLGYIYLLFYKMEFMKKKRYLAKDYLRVFETSGLIRPHLYKPFIVENK